METVVSEDQQFLFPFTVIQDNPAGSSHNLLHVCLAAVVSVNRQYG